MTQRDPFLLPYGERSIPRVGAKWRRFKEDIVIEFAGIHILEMVQNAPDPQTTIYSVLLLCCGKRVTLTHRQISRKIYNRRHNCAKCGHDAAVATHLRNNAAMGKRKRAPRVRRSNASAFGQGPTWPAIKAQSAESPLDHPPEAAP